MGTLYREHAAAATAANMSTSMFDLAEFSTIPPAGRVRLPAVRTRTADGCRRAGFDG